MLPTIAVAEGGGCLSRVQCALATSASFLPFYTVLPWSWWICIENLCWTLFINPTPHLISSEDVFFCHLSGKVPLSFPSSILQQDLVILIPFRSCIFLILFIAQTLFTLCSLSEKSCWCPRQLPPLPVVTSLTIYEYYQVFEARHWWSSCLCRGPLLRYSKNGTSSEPVNGMIIALYLQTGSCPLCLSIFKYPFLYWGYKAAVKQACGFSPLQAGTMSLLVGEDDVWTQESLTCPSGQALPAYLSPG